MRMLSVIVPCYNEEESVADFYQELMKNDAFFKEKELEVEVLFIDDGSRDNTAAEVKKLREAELIYETRRKNFIFYELDLTVLDEAILWLDNLRGGADHEQNAEKNVYCLRPADPSDADSGAGGAALSAGPHPGPL